MAIMTLQDRIVLIGSNLESIKRAVKNGNNDAIAEFFKAIASVAVEGGEIYTSMEVGTGAPTGSP